MMPGDWMLAIDFGTSFTSSAIRAGDEIEALEVEDSSRFPSSVLLADGGSFLTGKTALSEARRDPVRFERCPKRLLGQPATLLGDQPAEVPEMVAAVLRKVYESSVTRQGSAAPRKVRLTHPAGWGPERKEVLRDAARRAGIESVELVTEPEAAAWYFVDDRRGAEPVIEKGSCVAIYDLGGGTFDTAILRLEDDGFKLAGLPSGLDWFGGEDFDQKLYDLVLGRLYELDVATWKELKSPSNLSWRRTALHLRQDVRTAKESLSTMSRVTVSVPSGADLVEIEVTRGELEELIRRDVQRSVDVLDKTARDAGVSRDEIAAVYLTGGSSRVPLVAALVSEYHDKTFTRPDPKTLVARGALAVPEFDEREGAVEPEPSEQAIESAAALPRKTVPAQKSQKRARSAQQQRRLMLLVAGVAVLALLAVAGYALLAGGEDAGDTGELESALPPAVVAAGCNPASGSQLPAILRQLPGGAPTSLDCGQDDVIYVPTSGVSQADAYFNHAAGEIDAAACAGLDSQNWQNGRVACGADLASGEPVLIWTDTASTPPSLGVYSPLASSEKDLVTGWRARVLEDGGGA